MHEDGIVSKYAYDTASVHYNYILKVHTTCLLQFLSGILMRAGRARSSHTRSHRSSRAKKIHGTAALLAAASVSEQGIFLDGLERASPNLKT